VGILRGVDCVRLVSSSLVDGDPVILGAYPVYYLTSRVLTVAT